MSEQKDEKQEFVSQLISNLKRERDELSLQIHLGKEELKQEWEELDDKFAQLNSQYEPVKDAIADTADDVWESLKLVGEEVLNGFHRIRKSL